MANVLLTSTLITKTGVDSAPAAAAADGNSVGNNGKKFLRFVNAHATLSRTVTFDATQTVDGLAVADRTLVVPALSERVIGPFKPSVFGDTVVWTYSSEADLSVKAFEFTADPN